MPRRPLGWNFHYEEREVLEVVKGMDRDKALGPDGFSMAFYHCV
jgi:hypothetical protein